MTKGIKGASRFEKRIIQRTKFGSSLGGYKPSMGGNTLGHKSLKEKILKKKKKIEEKEIV